MCELHNNHTHQGESGPGLDQRRLRAFQLQRDFERAHGRRRLYQSWAPSPESAHEEWKGEKVKKKNHIFLIISLYIRSQLQNNYISRRSNLPHLHVLHLVGLLVAGLPAFLSSRGLLDIQVVAVDRSAAIKCRRLPQDHGGGVANLQHMKTNRRTSEDKSDSLNNVGTIFGIGYLSGMPCGKYKVPELTTVSTLLPQSLLFLYHCN